MSTSLMTEVKINCFDGAYVGRTEILIDDGRGFEGVLGNYYDYMTGKIKFEEVTEVAISGKAKITYQQDDLVVVDFFENSIKVGTLTAHSRDPFTGFSELVYKGKRFGVYLGCSF